LTNHSRLLSSNSSVIDKILKARIRLEIKIGLKFAVAYYFFSSYRSYMETDNLFLFLATIRNIEKLELLRKQKIETQMLLYVLLMDTHLKS